jgi:hypothetical protein
MKYMLLIYADENALNDAERQDCYRKASLVSEELRASGNYLDASPLQATSTASSVKVRNGRRLVTDGPFAETREQLGGFFLIDARDLDEALAIAARLPMAQWGTIEVRPLVEIAGLQATSG